MCDQLQAEVLRPESQCITPNFDALVKNGMLFERAYTPNAICSPARASLMTGLLPHNHGVLCVTHNVDDDQAVLREEKPHWAQYLVNSGYRTGYFGKWHVERSCDLSKFGWQVNGESSTALYKKKRDEIWGGEEYKITYSISKYHENPPGYKPQLFYGVTSVAPEKRPMGIITSMAVDFLDEASQNDDPWCCFVSINEPHDPFVCGIEAFEMYDTDSIILPPNIHDDLSNKPNIYKKVSKVFGDLTEEEHKMARRCYYASITEIDSLFGRLINKVKEMGELDNTIIILTTDHGEMLGAHGLYCKNIGAWEEVYNIPLVMAGPGIEKGVKTAAKVGLHDLCQTILELAGCDTIDIPDSRSFAAVCRDHKACESEFNKGFAEYFGGRIWLTQRVVWDGPWKYIFNGFDFDELYNLDDDPYEMKNLIDEPQYQHIVKELCAYMWKVIKDTNDHSLYNSSYPILRVAPFGPGIAEK